MLTVRYLIDVRNASLESGLGNSIYLRKSRPLTLNMRARQESSLPHQSHYEKMTCTVSIIEVQFLDIRASSACAPPSTGEHVDKFADIIGMAGMIPRGSESSVQSDIW